MLATRSQHLSWPKSLPLHDRFNRGLWRLVEWFLRAKAAQSQPVPQPASAIAKPILIDGVEYVDVGRRFPIRADRFDNFYRAADEF